MKLTEIYNKSMKEILEDCEIIEQRIHTDDSGNIKTIEMKYRPKDIGDTIEEGFRNKQL